jgi:hypothetical protein
MLRDLIGFAALMIGAIVVPLWMARAVLGAILALLQQTRNQG